jgi:hypothetical protein
MIDISRGFKKKIQKTVGMVDIGHYLESFTAAATT